MNDAVRVRKRDGIEDAIEHGQPARERRPVADHIVEAPALDELHDVEHAPVCERAGIMDGNDARVIEPGQDVRFALEPARP